MIIISNKKGVAAAAALGIANATQLNVLASDGWGRVILAGVLSVTGIRGLVKVHNGGDGTVRQLVGWLDTLMDAALVALDDHRARGAGLPPVGSIMRGVSFQKAQAVLPNFCLANPGDVAADITRIKALGASDRVNAILLGSALL